MKTALVLCGGGSRGSYEMGFWRAVREANAQYDMIFGTSIGSINGALMAQGDYDRALELWSTITIDDVMESGINLDLSLSSMFSQRREIIPFIKEYVQHGGANITPFLDLLAHTVDERRVRASGIGYGLVTVRVSSVSSAELMLEDIPEGELMEYILASAACFPAFPMARLKGKSYIDGGYYDNLPINMAIRAGADRIVAIDLEYNPTHPDYTGKPYVTYSTPSQPLGSILMFEREVLDRNMTLGYLDGLRLFGRALGFRYTFTPESVRARKDCVYAFSRRVALHEAYMSTQGANMLRRKRSVAFSLTRALESDVRGVNTITDYYLRALECLGGILDIPPVQLYTLDEFLSEARERMTQREHDEPPGLPARILEGVMADITSRLSRLSVLLYLARRLEDWSQPDPMPDVLRLTAVAFPRETAAAYALIVSDCVPDE